MKYDVVCRAFHPVTGDPLMKGSRTERVDTATNPIFKDCKSILQVKDAYESFWNHLTSYPREIVMVCRVKPVQEKRKRK